MSALKPVPRYTISAASVAEFGRGITATDVSRAFRETRTKIYNGFAQVLERFDFLVTATTPVPPFRHSAGKGGADIVDEQPVRHPALFFHRLTEPPTHAGLPAVSMPCGFTREGLPVGLQIIGRPHADADVVAVAAAFEKIAPHWQQRPLAS